MKGIIICSGSITDYSFYKNYFYGVDLIIGVDGGAKHTRELGVVPNVLLGDFDSINKSDLEYCKRIGVEIISFPREKDNTDSDIAIDFAIERGCEEILILGGLGSRFDHSLSNVFLLKKLQDKGINATLVNENNEITIINNEKVFQKGCYEKITLISLTDTVEGINTEGLYYELKDATLNFGSSLGISNEFLNDSAKISIKNGILLVIKSKD